RELERAGLVDVATLEWGCLPAVVEMELHGIGVDQTALLTLGQQREVETAEAATTLMGLLHRPQEPEQPALFAGPPATINLDSPAQVLQALQALGVPVEGTSKWALAPLAEAFPVVKALLDYRTVRKALTIAQALPTHLHLVTGRLHPTYWQLGAATG